ncbi:MAG TPA: peptidoglycan-binding domain-containing protein [Candidatus Paceibacterota bacterium]|nr:peptidoglycan-binding domain-containing protein [Candidatus Paceibacterota bacterium]
MHRARQHPFLAAALGMLCVLPFLAAMPQRAVAADLSLPQLVSLFISLGIIPAEKADAARAAIARMGAGSGSAAACADISHALSLGSTDAATSGDVSALQRLLTQTGDYAYRTITGYFGPVTQQALERYQARLGIVSAGSPATTGYGRAGPATRRAMRCAAAGTGSAAVPGSSEASTLPGSSAAASSTAAASTASATIDDVPLSVETGDLILTGSATGTASLIPVIIPGSYDGPTNWLSIGGVLSGQSHGELDGTSVYAFTVPVVGGRWFTYFTGLLPGAYDVLVYDALPASHPLVTTGEVTIASATSTSATCTLSPSATTTSVGTPFTLAWTSDGVEAPILYENDAQVVSAREIPADGSLPYQDSQPTVHVFGIGDTHSVYCHATVSTR